MQFAHKTMLIPHNHATFLAPLQVPTSCISPCPSAGWFGGRAASSLRSAKYPGEALSFDMEQFAARLER
jgi:hypothetical protein